MKTESRGKRERDGNGFDGFSVGLTEDGVVLQRKRSRTAIDLTDV